MNVEVKKNEMYCMWKIYQEPLWDLWTNLLQQIGGGRMMGQMRQLGMEGTLTDNPHKVRCMFHGCQRILVPGKVYTLRLIDDADDVREWIMCSVYCYEILDKIIEAMMESNPTHVATIDGGIPDSWSP